MYLLFSTGGWLTLCQNCVKSMFTALLHGHQLVLPQEGKEFLEREKTKEEESKEKEEETK